MRDTIWRCADGRRIPISQMELRHLRNCIAMIKRGHDAQGRRVSRRTKSILPRLEIELVIRNIHTYNNPLWG